MIRQSDPAEYRRIMSLILKIIQEIGRQLQKLGLTLTSQPYIPADERKTYDPKAVLQLQQRVLQLKENILKEKLPEPPVTEPSPEQEIPPIPLIVKKKKKKKKEKKEHG
jgi:hypothetical protein